MDVNTQWDHHLQIISHNESMIHWNYGEKDLEKSKIWMAPGPCRPIVYVLSDVTHIHTLTEGNSNFLQNSSSQETPRQPHTQTHQDQCKYLWTMYFNSNYYSFVPLDLYVWMSNNKVNAKAEIVITYTQKKKLFVRITYLKCA